MQFSDSKPLHPFGFYKATTHDYEDKDKHPFWQMNDQESKVVYKPLQYSIDVIANMKPIPPEVACRPKMTEKCIQKDERDPDKKFMRRSEMREAHNLCMNEAKFRSNVYYPKPPDQDDVEAWE